MNVKEKLTQRFSKAELLVMVDYFVERPSKVKELMSCLFMQEHKIDQYAAWIVPYIAMREPKLLKPYYGKILDNLDTQPHTGVIRNSLRIFEEVDIPESIEGRLFDKCMDYIADHKMPVAVPAFAITVCTKICKKYPDLSEEFVELIRPFLDHGSAALKVRTRRAIKQLSKRK